MIILVVGILAISSHIRRRAHFTPALSQRDVNFIPVPTGAAIDDPLWVTRHLLFATAWHGTNPSLARVDPARRRIVPVSTLTLRGCGLTSAQFATRKDEGAIVYRLDCFTPAPWRLRSLEHLARFAIYDMSTGQNRLYGSISLPIGTAGRFTFSPNGTRAILASGGLYSHLDWFSPGKLTMIPQGLASAAAPSWSPDGRLVVIAGVPRSKGDITLQATNLYAFRPGTPQRLRLIIRGLEDFRPYKVAWFPGRRGWFVSALQPSGQPDGIWLVDALTRHKALLLRGTDFGGTAVSPDGRTLATDIGSEAEYSKNSRTRAGLELIRLPDARWLDQLMK